MHACRSTLEDPTQLRDWNDTTQVFPAEACIHTLFEMQVARAPDAVAVVFEGASLSYAELEARANQLAHHLRSLGVGPDARVALLLERGMAMVVALLATLKAGGAYVPLDPAYPADRLAFMLDDCRPAVLLTESGCDGLVALPAQLPVCRLDQAEGPWLALPRTPPAVPDLRPQHLAYVIYTSGSTGRPKGVMNAHAPVVNRLRWMQQAYGLAPDEAVLQKTPFSFDVSVWEFFWTWMAGARLVLARPEGHKDPVYLADLIEREQVSTLHFVPSMLPPFLASLDPHACPSLRRIICSGEALPPATAAEALRRLPQARLHNLYGPTEAAVDVTAWACTGAEELSVPIGQPIANTRIHVLDALGQQVPAGVAGELHIAGVQVARGYFNRPDLTAERFVPDPFGAPGSRMYRTGDLARWRADGVLEYLGRNDHQVKIRGFRIELGEIEAALQACDGVREAVVLARGEDANKRLVAYLTGEPLEVQVLREHLADLLPEYMVPAAYVQLDVLPLTPNGKLDRGALPDPDGTAFGVRAFEAPQGPVEETLASIWQELLGIDRIGRADDFFALGGHSLLAVQMIARVGARLGAEVPVGELFAHPTLEGFAHRVAAAESVAAAPVLPIDRSAHRKRVRVPTGK